MNEIIIAVIASGLLTTIINRIFNNIDKKKSNEDELKELCMAITGWQLRVACKEAIKHNSISAEELKQIIDMNELYRRVGGNGYIKNLLVKVAELPVEIGD